MVRTLQAATHSCAKPSMQSYAAAITTRTLGHWVQASVLAKEAKVEIVKAGAEQREAKGCIKDILSKKSGQNPHPYQSGKSNVVHIASLEHPAIQSI